MPFRNLLHRFRFVAAVLLLLLGTGAFSAGSALADSPHAPSNDQQVIDGMYSSIESSVNNLQKASSVAKVEAAGLILKSANAQLAHLSDPSSPGTTVGGLDLYDYCLGNGFANGSVTAVPGIESIGGAYTWYCVAADGTQTALDMQDACDAQYPTQVTVAYAQDPNNSYSWVCIAPAVGSYADPVTGATVTSITTAGSAATLISLSGSEYLAVNDDGNAASAILTAQAQNSSMSYTNIMTVQNGVKTAVNHTLSDLGKNSAEAANKANQILSGFGN